MEDIARKRKRAARYLLFRYNLSKFSYEFKHVFLLYLWVLVLYKGYLMLEIQWWETYYLYAIIFIGFVMFWYGIRGCMGVFRAYMLKKALIKWWEKLDVSVYRVEYIESWSSYQKWSFIFARPETWILEGTGIIFKSEKFSFKIPEYVIRPWMHITVYTDVRDTSNYYMDVERILKNIIKEKPRNH